MTNATLRGKPDAGNPHVRFDEGEVAPAKPGRGSLLYKKTVIGLAALTALVAMGEDWPGTGIFTWSTISDFGDGTTPFTLGQGILEYTGLSGEVTVPLVFNPSDNRPATVRVTNPETTLTVSGQVTQSTGAFIKDGPGTLRFTYPGVNTIGLSREAENKDGSLIAWDENGAVTNNGYAKFTINEGRVIFDCGPESSNHVESVSWIGSRTQKDTRLDIKGGKLTGNNNWFCLSRGAGQTNNTVRSDVYISDAAEVNLLGGICMNNNNNTPGYYGRTLLYVDHSTVTLGGSFFQGEGAGEPTLIVTNGAKLVCNNNSSAETGGFQIGRNSSGAKAKTEIVDGSTVETYALYVNSGTSLKVKDSTLKFDRTLQTSARSDTLNVGDVTFDNATLGSRVSNAMPDWFNAQVDAPINVLGTLSVTAPAFAGIGRTLQAGGTGAAVEKNGNGYLTLRATELPVTANAGTLRMSVPTTSKTNGLTGTISLASGAALEVAGEDALGAMTVNADKAKFEPLGMETQRAGWTTTGFGRMRPDGVIQLMDNVGSTYGSARTNTKLPIDRSFRLSFDTFLYTTSARPADQLNIHFLEGSISNGSYTGGGANSFTVSVDYYWYCVRFMVEAAEKAKLSTANYSQIYAGFNAKRHYTIAYDVDAKKVDFTITYPDGTYYTWDYAVDLEAVCGEKSAYLGFGANTGGSYGTFSVTNLRFEEPGTPEVGFVGGRKTLAANETFTAQIAPTESQDAFLMGSLDYADGAAVCVTNVMLPNRQLARMYEPSTEDSTQWTLTGGAYWRDDGSLATSCGIKTGSSYKSGTATTRFNVPIAGDWTASFDWQLGEHSGSPADAFGFQLRSGSSTVLDLNCRYYYDYTENEVKKNTRLTRVLLSREGVQLSEQLCTNAAPVDLAQKGPAHFVLNYRRDAGELDLTISQENGARTFTRTYTNVVLQARALAQICFYGTVGGLYAENVISNLVFQNAGLASAVAQQDDRIGSFGFERLNGSGTLVKTGPGDLALVSTDNASTAVRIDEGGLCLRKLEQEPTTARFGGWQFNHASGRSYFPNGLQIGEKKSNHASTVHTKRKVCVSGDWRCAFSVWVDSGTPADALSFFLHNDARGNGVSGSNVSNAGYTGIQNSVAVAWYFYPNNGAGWYKKVAIAKNGGAPNFGTGQSHDPLTLVGQTTDVVLTYDATAKTLTSVMTQGATSVTNTFADVDVAGCVKGDFAYLGFGLGCGGSQATPRFTNVRFERLSRADRTPTAAYLASVEVRNDATVRMDTSLTNAVFTLAPSVTLVAAKMLSAKSLNAASTLTMGTLTLGEGSILAGDDATVIAPEALAGEVGSLALDTVTLAINENLVAARALNQTELHLTHGAKLAVKGNRVLSIGKLFIDGVRVQGSVFHAGEADWVSEGGVALGGGTFLILR